MNRGGWRMPQRWDVTRPSHRAAAFLVAGVSALLSASCAKLSESPEAAQKGVKAVELTDDSTVPAEWGDLTAVSSVAESPGYLQLWFQDTEGTVRMVWYNVREHRLSRNGRVILRK